MYKRITRPGTAVAGKTPRQYLSRVPTSVHASHPISALQYENDPTQSFLFPPALRQYHMQVLGRPGGGKTKFLEACIRQDIIKGHGLLLIDPAGNLYNDLTKWIIQNGYLRSRKVLLLNPNHPTHTFAFNPLEVEPIAGESARDRLTRIGHAVDATMLAIASIQGGENLDSQPRYNHVMRHILHVLAENNLTLCDSHIFTNYDRMDERRALYERSNSQAIREEWRKFDGKRRSDFELFMEAPTNRLARFSSATLSCIVGQRKSSFDFKKAMDEGATILVHTGMDPAGLTDTESKILGRLLLNNLTMRARERYTINGRKPREFYCYIDECDRYLNDDIATGIDKLRQFGLRMILSHQSIAQLDEAGIKVRGSVLGSTATKVFFALSDEDAELVVQRVYNGRIRYDETIDALDKPTVVGYTIGHLRNFSRSEAGGEGKAIAQAKGSASASSAGQALQGDPGFFGMGESEISHMRADSTSKSTSESVASSTFSTSSSSEGVSETLIPEMAMLPTARLSLEEQLMEHKRYLVLMPTQHCVVTLPHAVSFDAIVAHTNTPVVSDQRLLERHTQYYERQGDLYRRKDAVFAALNQDATFSVTDSPLADDEESITFS
ncbi:type IV secretory system conjugative DNA transfer family protein [Granulosicoccus sp. 3-233]|uniref:type IV secretory system conjugative DNA transfer family protein n=1 Tax=Granulosicoccus sp. 3-233 TaxID=3417969 RepID=UPI003D32993B